MAHRHYFRVKLRDFEAEGAGYGIAAALAAMLLLGAVACFALRVAPAG